jgi:alpha-beta hydrolase superfamily lysophospholipase
MEKEIKLSGENTIYGSIRIPEGGGKYPAILIIAGSGPLDRDGNDRKGKYPTNLYKELAHYMTDLGFVTFRYDKRGTGKSDGEWLATGLSDLVEDAKKSIEFLLSHPNVDTEKIIVCGHSEGTVIATKLTELFNLAGVMLLSGGVDNVIEATKKQRLLSYKELQESPGFKGWLYRQLKIDVKGEKQFEKQMKKIIESEKDIVKIQLFFKYPAKWTREHNAYNTRESLKKVTCPVLAIQGDKDVLVDGEVLNELSSLVQGKSEFHIIPNMEHGLKVQTEPKSILNMQKIFKEILKRPIHEDALKTMTIWLKENYKTDAIIIDYREIG